MKRNHQLQVTEERWQQVFAFLEANPDLLSGRGLIWRGDLPETPYPKGLEFVSTAGNEGLHLGFTMRENGQHQIGHDMPKGPLLLAGFGGLPLRPDHVCIPFEGMRFNLGWIRALIAEAEHLGWHPRLVYCEQGFIPHEIMRLAEWFHLDSVKEALGRWLTEEVKQAFRDLVDRYPDLRIETGIGRLKKMLATENPSETLIMGSLSPGYHLPGRRHGVHYASLLNQTGLSGYFR